MTATNEQWYGPSLKTDQAPTTFTTYLGAYGSPQPAYNGASQTLPLRAYLPGGASQMTYFETTLKDVSSGATEFTIFLTSNNAGGFALSLTNGTINAPAWPAPLISASGTPVTLNTPITVGTLSITAYRFALVGNEMQLDLISFLLFQQHDQKI